MIIKNNFLIITILSSAFVVGMEEANNFPQIFFLNGPSSSGKTTLALQLQHALQPHAYYIKSYDEFRENDLVKRVKENNLVPDNYVFTTVHTLFEDVNSAINNTKDIDEQLLLRTLWVTSIEASSKAFYEHIHAAASQGNKLIVDTVVMNEQLQKQMETLRIYTMCTVFTRITLDTLKERIAKRNLSDSPKEHRSLERIMRVYPLYCNQEGNPLYTHDIIVDTGALTPQEAAAYVINFYSRL